MSTKADQLQIQLLADLRVLFEKRESDTLGSAEIIADLTAREDRPWMEWQKGKPLTVRQLARLLRPFGVRPAKIRRGAETCQGYELEALQDAFERYLPRDPEQAEQPNNDAGTTPSCDPEHDPHVPDHETRETPRHPQSVPDVPDPHPGVARSVAAPEGGNGVPDLADDQLRMLERHGWDPVGEGTTTAPSSRPQSERSSRPVLTLETAPRPESQGGQEAPQK